MELNSENVANRFSEMSHFYEGVLTPEEEKNGLGLVLFKPDATSTLLDNTIREFLKREIERSTGKQAELFAFSQRRLDADTVKKLYPEQKHEQYLKYITDHFGSGPVGIVLIAAKDAPQVLNMLKGSIKTGQGVRGTFRMGKPIDQATLEAWQEGRLSDDLSRKIGAELFASNLIHVPDDKDNTRKGSRRNESVNPLL